MPNVILRLLNLYFKHNQEFYSTCREGFILEAFTAFFRNIDITNTNVKSSN